MNTTAKRAASVTVRLDAEACAALDRAARDAMLSRPSLLRLALSRLIRDASALRAIAGEAAR